MSIEAREEDETLPERVESLPVGTRFISYDDLDRHTSMMKVFGGRCLTEYGDPFQRPFIYGDNYGDWDGPGYDIVITHLPTKIMTYEERRAALRMPAGLWSTDGKL